MTPARTSFPHLHLALSIALSPSLASLHLSYTCVAVNITFLPFFSIHYFCLLCPRLQCVRVMCRYILQKLQHFLLYWIIDNTTVRIAWMTRNCLCFSSIGCCRTLSHQGKPPSRVPISS